MKKIAFDLDGVVINLHENIRQKALAKYGFDINSSCTRHHIEIPGVSNSKVATMVYDAVEDGTTLPYPGAIQALERMHMKTRHPLVFVTARPEKYREATHAWLFHNLRYSCVLVTTSDKAGWLAEHGFSIFVDDRFKNAVEISAAGLQVFMPSRKWNEGRDPGPGVTRVNGVQEAIALALK